MFVNSVYLYDDKTVIFYNIRGGKQVSFHDVKTALDDESRAESECSYLNTIASARVTKYEHYYVFVSGVLGLVVMKPDKK